MTSDVSRTGPLSSRLALRAGFLVIGIVLVVLPSCGSNGLGATTGLPSLRSGCATVPALTGPTTIPMTLGRAGSGEVPLVSVCVDGHGPYPFVVASGAGQSVIDPRLADSLKLPTVARSEPVQGATCVTQAPEVNVQSWSFGGVRLASQGVVRASVPGQGLEQEPLGMIGSDVLSRFGAIRIDYKAKRLRVVGAEGPSRTGNNFVLGQTTPSPPAGLVNGPPRAGVVLSVLESPQGTVTGVPITFGAHGTKQFTVDTGSALSSVNSTAASALALPTTSQRANAWGIGCSGSVAQVSSGTWSIGLLPLTQGGLSVVTFAGVTNQGFSGAIGSDVLSSFGSVVIDYQGARLWLGAG